MKSSVLSAPGRIEIRELPIPAPGAGQVLVKVMACGVCGTDVHIFEGDKGAADNPFPIVLGHEFSGVVESVGSGVRDICAGDRVCVDPNVLCTRCRYCKNGMGNFCEHMIGIGTTVNGGFSQYCAVLQQQVYSLSDSTSFAQGAMAEPLACCLHGMDLCEMRAGSNVVVIGGGMIGLLMLQLARLQGAASVALVEPVSAKRIMGQALGADLCIDPNAQDTAQVLMQAGMSQIDTVIECVGRTETLRDAIRLAGKRSTVMMFGLTRPDEELPVKPFELFKKEITLKASFINPYTMGRAVALINSGRVDVSSMVTDPIPLERLGEVLASPTLRGKGKYLVQPWQ